MLYHPEMEEKAEKLLFHSEHNYGNDYTVAWRTEDNACALAVLKKLRIRPRVTPYIGKVGENLMARYMGGEVFITGVTGDAHSKLMAVNVTANRVLLD